MRSVAGAALEQVETPRLYQAQIITLPQPERILPERPSKAGAFGTLLAIGIGIGAIVGITCAAVRVFILP